MSTANREQYVPEPALILMGCRAWDAARPAPCPVCGDGIKKGDDASYCARCDSLSPRMESRVLAARAGLRIRRQLDDAEHRARTELRRLQRTTPVLSEIQRRRLWMGYSRSGIDSRNPEVANRAKTGRDWLVAIGQEPDWSITLDARGRPSGLVADSA
jgi:hypothetical protein